MKVPNFSTLRLKILSWLCRGVQATTVPQHFQEENYSLTIKSFKITKDSHFVSLKHYCWGGANIYNCIDTFHTSC